MSFIFNVGIIMFNKKVATAIAGAIFLISSAHAASVTRSCNYTVVGKQSDLNTNSTIKTGNKSGTAGTVYLARRKASENIINASWSSLDPDGYFWLTTPSDTYGATKTLKLTISGDNGCWGNKSVSRRY
jgi:hypothetical protein